MERPERLEMQSADGVQLNLDALYQIAPSCFTEAEDPKTGKVKRMVNFDILRQLLGDDSVEDAPEAYEFNWVGKQAARAEVVKPINKTLRPIKEDSVDWDNTQNLYIEGDNLEVLKLLQKSYLGKIKMIYIDPPYNTGNDFVYNDDRSRSIEEEDFEAGNIDELGYRYRKNTDSNGRFHSDWCSMMYTRLMVSRSLLTEDGVIFISIGQEELHNLIQISNEVFGEKNLEGIVSRQMKSGGNQGKSFSKNIDYILVYAKNTESLPPFREALEDELKDKVYNKVQKDGERAGERYRLMGLYQAGLNEWRPNQKYFITCPDGEIVLPPCSVFDETMREGDGRWRWSKPRFLEELEKGNVEFVETTSSPLVTENGKKSKWNVYTKIWLSDREEEGRIPIDLMTKLENRHSSLELKKLEIPFDFAKPVGLLTKLMEFIQTKDDCIILDFFSGSATTAHAVMQLNSTDGGTRRFIMVQLPEVTDESSATYKAGFKNICEIGKERIRRAGNKLKEESPLTTQDLDTGFRVFRVDESNFEAVEHTPKEWNQDQLDLFLNNIKSDRDDLDLLFGCMLDWGVQLSLPMTSEEVDGKMIYTVNDGDLVACFADDVTENVVKAMADKMPLRVIFRDSCFSEDSAKINIYETFKQLLDWSDQEVVKNIRVI